jgi:predicted dehydrogenase
VEECGVAKAVRIGIIGCGGIARNKHMPDLKKIEDVSMVAFCDIVIDRAHKAAAEFGEPEARVTADYRELLKDDSIDVVHVCTPNDMHGEITVAALRAGKHVMCEKPMAKTAQAAREMVAAAKESGKLLTIGYQNRYRPDSQYLHKVCERGDLGRIYYAKAHAVRRRAVPTWGVFLDEEKQGGGPLIDIGTHALDLTLWMMDNYEPRMAVGTTYHELAKKRDAANAWGPWDPDTFTVEDSAFGFIVMKDGATIVLESSWALNTLDTGEAKCTLCGTEGGADMREGLRLNGEDFGRLHTHTVALGRQGVDFFDGERESASLVEARTWIAAVRGEGALTVLPHQALVVTEILEGLYTSARTGEPFYF